MTVFAASSSLNLHVWELILYVSAFILFAMSNEIAIDLRLHTFVIFFFFLVKSLVKELVNLFLIYVPGISSLVFGYQLL